MKKLSIVEQFSKFPGLRHCKISDNSGEAFYHKLLNGAFAANLDRGDILTVVLDEVNGYASSFLDEAFGNLVYDFGIDTVQHHLRIISEEEPHWLGMLSRQTYPQWEQRRQRQEAPRVTAEHAAWYRLIDNKLKKEVWEHPSA